MSKKSKRKPKTLDDFKTKSVPKPPKLPKPPKPPSKKKPEKRQEASRSPSNEPELEPLPERTLSEPEPEPPYQEMPPELEPPPDMAELYGKKRTPKMFEGEAASTSIDWTNPIKAEQLRKDSGVSFEVSAKSKWSPDEWAFHLSKRIREDYQFMATSKRSHLWIYQEESGIWIKGGVEKIHSELVRLMAPRYSSRVAGTVEDIIRGSNYVSPDIIGGPANKIVLKNGIYDLREHKFYDEFAPDEYHITAVGVTYDPQADCPRFKQFLEDVVQSEKDELTGKADADAVMEFFGLCLHKGNPTPKLMALHGKSRTGKSTLLDVLERFLGEENCSSITPQQLADRYMEARLHGKLANIASDIPISQILITRVNRATGGDTSTVREIYRAPFDMKPYAKWIFSANSLPKIVGTSKEIDAFCKRVCTIELKHEFEAGNRDTLPKHMVVDSVTRDKELSGILNMSLEGNRRLDKNGYVFSGEKTLDDKREIWLVEGDSAELFREECIAINPRAKRYSKNWWYNMYCRYCDSRGISPVGLRMFSRRLKELIPEADGTQREGPAGGQYRVWSNIEFTGYDEYNEPPDSY